MIELDRNIDDSETDELEREFISSYFDLLNYAMGEDPEFTPETFEAVILPRILAMKMLMKQFDKIVPELSQEMDRSVDQLEEAMRDKIGLDAVMRQILGDVKDDDDPTRYS